MSFLKKLWKFISSMQFAIILLVVLAAACCVGSFVTQGLTYEEYAQLYSERRAALIMAVGLDDVFHCLWFLLIAAFLCCNLLLCNLLRLPQLIRRTKRAYDPEAARRGPVTASVAAVKDPEILFEKLRMPSPRRVLAEDGSEYLFSGKHRIGLWGAWVCHLGILCLIVAFSLGQMTHREYTVYGVPGQTKLIGDTGLLLTIDAFEVGLREDDTVSQYTAQITVRDMYGEELKAESAEISVNNPADLFGLRFYQNSTGWAANVSVLKGGELLQEEILCAGEYLQVEDKPGLIVLFNAFYPDYVQVPGQGPTTASGRLNNPAYLYMLYYQEELVGMNVLTQNDVITVDEYTIVFSQPQSYTLIQIKQDRFTGLALFSGLFVLLGLVLAFYLRHTKLWAVQGEDGLWTVSGHCLKGGAMFRTQLEEAAGSPDASDGKPQNTDETEA